MPYTHTQFQFGYNTYEHYIWKQYDVLPRQLCINLNFDQ